MGQTFVYNTGEAEEFKEELKVVFGVFIDVEFHKKV